MLKFSYLTAKWDVILLKNSKVIDFLTWPPTDFPVFKNVQAENATLFLFLKTGIRLLPMTSQCRFDKQ